MADVLFGDEFEDVTYYMIDAFPEGYENFTFENDNHWNEAGNLRAARAMAAWGDASGYWQMDEARWMTLESATTVSINDLYGAER